MSRFLAIFSEIAQNKLLNLLKRKSQVKQNAK